MSNTMTTAAGIFYGEPDLPLSFMQEAILAHQVLASEHNSYNVPVVLTWCGDVDRQRLQTALNVLVGRHEILRSLYQETATGVQLAIAPEASLTLQYQVLQDEGALVEQIGVLTRQGFNLSQDLPVRAHLLSLDTQQTLVLVFHHIAVDGGSVRILLSELSSAYSAQEVGPELPFEYADWAAWQRDTIGGQQVAQMQARARVHYADTVLALDFGQGSKSTQAKMLNFALDHGQTNRVEQIAQANSVSPYVVLLAAWSLLLARLGDQRILGLATPMSLRDRAELDALVGCFIHTTLVKVDTTMNTVGDLLQTLRQSVLETMDLRLLPFPLLLRTSEVAEASCFFNFDDARISPPRLGELDVSIVDTEQGTAKFDLMLTMVRADSGIRAAIDYRQGVLPEALIASLPQEFKRILVGLSEPQQTVDQLLHLAFSDQLSVLVGPRSALPSGVTVVSAIFAASRRYEAHTAVVGQSLSLSYQEYIYAVQQCAELLRAQGVKPGNQVAIALARAPELMVAKAAVLWLGAAYVPMDPAWPIARQNYVINDSQASLVILPPAVEAIDASFEVFRMPPVTLLSSPTSNQNDHALPTPVSGSDLAYIIYTSGSTGLPKGVAVTHAALMNYLQWAIKAYGLSDATQSAVITATAFDATLLSLWAPLMVGGSVHLLPEEHTMDALQKYLAGGVEQLLLKLTPAHLDLLSEYPDVLSRCTSALLVVGGDALVASSVIGLLAQSDLTIVNEYGPTEATVGCCIYSVNASNQSDLMAWGGAVPIGLPIANTTLQLLDSERRPVPKGLSGELYIAGNSLAEGYWANRDLTDEVFVTIPNGTPAGLRMYKTGDQARLLPSGDLVYQGRLDRQLKLRGYRIEPAEVETVLRQVAGVTQAYVAIVGQGDQAQLTAWVVSSVPTDAVQAELQRRLPSYLVPQRLESVQTLPLTLNGKIDQESLLQRLAATEVSSAYTGSLAPDSTAGSVLQLIRELLGREDLGADDDFFAYGGTSLTAIRLVARLQRTLALAIDVPKDLVHSGRTAAGMTFRLAELAAKNESQSSNAAVVEQLLTLMREVLGQEQLNEQDDFFALGGSSMAAIRLVARLQRSFGHDVPKDIVHRGRNVLGIVALLPEMTDAKPSALSTVSQIPMLSPLEKPFLVEYEFAKEGADYVMQIALALDFDVSETDLKNATENLVLRHPKLRTAYCWEAGQLVVQEQSSGVSFVATPTKSGCFSNVLTFWAQQDRHRAFDLALGETSRIRLIKHAEKTAVLISLHHVISDAETRTIVAMDLMRLLNRQGLPPLAETYQAFASARNQQTQRHGVRDADYWCRQLAHLDLRQRLPNVAGGDESKPVAAVHTLTLGAQEVGRLDEWARSEQCSLFAVLAASYAHLYARLSGDSKVVFGVPVDERAGQYSGVVGNFINTLPLLLDVSPGLADMALVKHAQSQFNALLAHSSVTMLDIAAAVRSSSQLHAPVLHSVLDWRDTAGSHSDLGQTLVGIEEIPLASANAPFDLALSAQRTSEGAIQCHFIYNVSRLDLPHVQAWSDAFEASLLTLGRPPVSQVPAPAKAELPEPNLVELLLQVARQHGDLDAIRCGDQHLTYTELIERASALTLGGASLCVVDTADPLQRLIHALAAILQRRSLAIIDPNLPLARQALMRHALEGQGVQPIGWVQFTSGSTGTPKGAVLEYSALASITRSAAEALGIGPGSRVLGVAGPAFDGWYWDVFNALLSGATLVIPNQSHALVGDALASCLKGESITHMTLTPSVLSTVTPSYLSALEAIVLVGEMSSAQLVQSWLATGVSVFNAYGPCEATICATITKLNSKQSPAYLGTGLPGVVLRVVDRLGLDALQGVDGELWIGGVGVGRGYLGSNADQSAFIQFLGQSYYRTGDYVCRANSQGIRFVGRADDQIKLRGVRIELGEIQAALLRQKNLRQVALGQLVVNGDMVLVAWIVGQFDPVSVRLALREHLSDAMIPSYFVAVNDLPLGPTGKLDRSALPAPDVTALSPVHDARHSDLAVQVSQVFAQVLNRSTLPGLDQDFFAIGGHSLAALQVINALRSLSDRALSPAEFFAAPSPLAIAALISEETSALCTVRALETDVGTVPEARPQGTGTVIFLGGLDGSTRVYEPLAKQLNSAYILAIDFTRLTDSFADQVNAAIRTLGQLPLAEPLVLVGWSMGGLMAAHLGAGLSAQGQLAHTILIDCAPPSATFDHDGLADELADLGLGVSLEEQINNRVVDAQNTVMPDSQGTASLVVSTSRADNPTGDLGWGKYWHSVTIYPVDLDHQAIIGAANYSRLSGLIDQHLTSDDLSVSDGR